jgi:hypothetical protein
MEKILEVMGVGMMAVEDGAVVEEEAEEEFRCLLEKSFSLVLKRSHRVQ